MFNDIIQSTFRIIKHIEFRQHFGLDTILEDWTPPEVLRQYTPGGFFGEDREGHPVWYDRMGNLDFRGELTEGVS